jgi:plasmid maintenance system killer protein
VLDKCEDVKALWKVPGLNIEKLNVRGADNCWSLRINRQWRVVFFWNEEPPEAAAVEICDYH